MEYPFVTNAIIESASIVIERGFILSGWVHLDFGGTCQGFGGFALGGIGDQKVSLAQHGCQPNLAAEWLVGVLRASGVEKLSDCAGKVVRVGKDDEWGKVRAIGHAVKSDRWFNPEAAFSALEARKVQP
jgi:hypothetical protein